MVPARPTGHLSTLLRLTSTCMPGYHPVPPIWGHQSYHIPSLIPGFLPINWYTMPFLKGLPSPHFSAPLDTNLLLSYLDKQVIYSYSLVFSLATLSQIQFSQDSVPNIPPEQFLPRSRMHCILPNTMWILSSHCPWSIDSNCCSFLLLLFWDISCLVYRTTILSATSPASPQQSVDRSASMEHLRVCQKPCLHSLLGDFI